MLCVHGYAGGHLWLETLAFDARRFYRAGVDVVLYVLPYHGRRMPPGAHRSGGPFFDVDLVRTNEAFAQTIYELRALLRWLRASGTGPVGAFGMSLGGYTTALLASVEPELAFAVPMIPLTSLPDMMWSEGAGDPRLARAVEHGWSLATLHDFFADLDADGPPLLLCVPAHFRAVCLDHGNASSRLHRSTGGGGSQRHRRDCQGIGAMRPAMAMKISVGRTPWSARVPLDPLFVWNQFPAEREWPARGPAADQGVRPTIYASARKN